MRQRLVLEVGDDLFDDGVVALLGLDEARTLKVYVPDTLTLLLRRAGFAAAVTGPSHGEDVDRLQAARRRRVLRAVSRGNQTNMLRALAIADPAGPARWRLSGAQILSGTPGAGRD